MNIRTDAQTNKEILRTLARYQQLAASMATPISVVLLPPLPPLVVISYEELSRSSQESDNSGITDVAAMVSHYESMQQSVKSLRQRFLCPVLREQWLTKVLDDHLSLMSELGLDKS